MHTNKEIAMYADHPDGHGYMDVGVIKLFRGVTLVSTRELQDLRTKGAPDEAVPLLKKTLTVLNDVIPGVKLKKTRMTLEDLRDEITNLIGDNDEQAD